MKIILFLFLIFTSSSALAQISSQQERIQAEQQRLLDEQFRQQELQRALKRPTSSGEKTEPKPFEKGLSAGCINITSVVFSGNSKIDTSTLNQAVSGYLNRCLSLSEIDTILNDITNLYLKKGFITSKAFLVMPQSRLKDGILEVKIIEGKVQQIDGLSMGQRISAFPFVVGNTLNLRDIEQGLEQINRLPSQNAAMEILPSPEPEKSIVKINNTVQGSTGLYFLADNAGADSTGNHRIGGKITQDNLLGINDQINLNYMNAPSKDTNKRDANYLTISYSVPFGYWTLTNNFSYSNYRTSMTLSNGLPFYSFGNSTTNTTNLERMLVRGQRYKLSANAGLTYKSNKNYTEVLDLKIKNDVSSRNLSTMNVGLSGTFFWNGGVLYVNPSYVQGLYLFGALDDRKSNFNQKAQYHLGKIYGYVNQNLGTGFSINSTADGQYTKDELFSSEGFYLGGEYSVRGFKNEGIQGDSGIVFRNDLNWNYKWFTLGTFFDWGTVKSNAPSSNRFVLSGAGIKAVLSTKYLTMSATYAKPQHRQAGMSENNAWYLSAQAALRF